MIEFARGHRGVKRVLGDLVAGEQGYVDLKKKLVKSALRPAMKMATDCTDCKGRFFCYLCNLCNLWLYGARRLMVQASPSRW